ncbi:hypothetical protein ACWDUM_18255 [Rhodococcus sp. NPDC003322]
MSADHAALMAELRALANAALDRLEPLLERAADVAAAVAPERGEDGAHEDGEDRGSACGWCPVCALVALVRGESHDLLTLVASQLSALLALVRALLDEHDGHGGPPEGGPDGDTTPPPRRAFVPIQVRIEDNPTA